MVHRTIILKLSGSSLKNNSLKSFDFEFINSLAESIKKAISLSEDKIVLHLIIGGGNIWKGEYENKIIKQDNSDYMGMYSTVINGICLHNVFKYHGLNTLLVSSKRVGTFCGIKYFEDVKDSQNIDIFINIFGTGMPYCSTDTHAVNIATEHKADMILFAKNDVDGLYNKDPNKNSDAIFIKNISYKEAIENKLKIIDSDLFSLCEINKIKLCFFNINSVDNIYKIILNKKVKYSLIS